MYIETECRICGTALVIRTGFRAANEEHRVCASCYHTEAESAEDMQRVLDILIPPDRASIRGRVRTPLRLIQGGKIC